MAGQYYGQNYFKADYWNDDYWALNAATVSGSFWNASYYSSDYWNPNYYLLSDTGPQDIAQANSPNIPISGNITIAGQSLVVEAQTGTNIPIAAFDTVAGISFDTFATAPNLPISGYSTSIQTTGYQLGDIDLRFVPNSTIVVTYGVVGTTPGIPIATTAHTIEEGGGFAVAASIASIPINALNTTTRQDVAVEPLPVNIPISGYNTTAGIGTQIVTTRPNVPINTGIQTIVATEAQAAIQSTVQAIPLSAYGATVVAFEHVPDADSFDARVRWQTDARARLQIQQDAAA